ncbi:hypothetical protein P4S54_08215 [Shewanella sp. PP-He15 brown]
METETIIKIITVIFGIIGAAKIIFDLSTGSKVKLRDEYRFAKEFLKDLTQEPKLHPLAIEKGYYAIAGTASIKSKEIEYILSLENPDRCLKDYTLSRKYLEHLGDNENTKIDFANKYKNPWPRAWRKAAYIITYVLGGFAAMSPFLLQQFLSAETKQVLVFSAITIPTFGVFAFDSLRSFIKISRAESLVKNQNKHTKLILVERSTARPFV